jgi:hypothetical protein
MAEYEYDEVEVSEVSETLDQLDSLADMSEVTEDNQELNLQDYQKLLEKNMTKTKIAKGNANPLFDFQRKSKFPLIFHLHS